MNFQYKQIAVDSNKYHHYELTEYTKVDAPIEFEVGTLIVKVHLKDNIDDRSDLLLDEKQGFYLSEYHAFKVFLNTFSILPVKLVKEFMNLCKGVVIEGNIKDSRYINRFEVYEKTLTLCKECVYDEVFLVDAVSEFILSKNCRLVGCALDKVIPESVADFRSDAAKEISQSIKGYIEYWKSHGDYNQKRLANNLDKYCKTPRHSKQDERPFINTLQSYRLCKVQFFVFYVLIRNDDFMVESTDGFKYLGKIVRLMENVYKNLEYLN